WSWALFSCFIRRIASSLSRPWPLLLLRARYGVSMREEGSIKQVIPIYLSTFPVYHSSVGEISREGNKSSSDTPKIEALINENKVAYTNEAQSILIGKTVTKVINDLNLIFYKERSWVGYKLTEKSNPDVVLSREVAQLNLLNEKEHQPKILEMLAKAELDALAYRHL
ncbi:MAG: hypothetical protein ACKN92_08140, partial [Candidatus Nanopelagicaceae bacterium]